MAILTTAELETLKIANNAEKAKIEARRAEISAEMERLKNLVGTREELRAANDKIKELKREDRRLSWTLDSLDRAMAEAEMYSRMYSEYFNREYATLSENEQETVARAIHMAYELGHSAGVSEIENYLMDTFEMIAPLINK